MSRVVVKLGGHAVSDARVDTPALAQLAEDVVALRRGGDEVVVVHGGGPQIASLLARLEVPERFHEGLRVTDDATLEVVALALSSLNQVITAALNRAGLEAVGLSGADASLLRASPLGAVWGRVGGVPRVDASVVTRAWFAGWTPVVSPLAVDDDGQLLNCNADTVAGALAGALGADTLVLLSDVDQLRSDPDDPSTALARVRSDEVEVMLASGTAREGMRPKMRAALDALRGGAARVVLADGRREHAVAGAVAGTIPVTEVRTSEPRLASEESP
ncbi:MAG: acetylglutamate kinase [Acidimicrobiales bacterium]